MTKPLPLRALDDNARRWRAARKEARRITDERYRLVIQAERAGLTRRTIAVALGITRQALDDFMERRERNG